MSNRHEITVADVLPMAEYAGQRGARRRQIAALKRNRRVAVGPDATFYFECYDTMWHQIHEMLYIEKGDVAAQLPDELAAYNPLVPKGDELVATVMFEIDDPARRAIVLGRLGGVEETAVIRFDGETVHGVPEEDLDRTTAAGKASAVQFIHFPFTAAQVAKFQTPGTQITLGFEHDHYAHLAVMPEAVREALAEDFG